MSAYWSVWCDALSVHLSASILAKAACPQHWTPLRKHDTNSICLYTHLDVALLCAEMATGTTAAKTTTTGTWAKNELYDTPPPVPCPRQNMGIPPTSNETTENISDPQKPMDIERPQNNGCTSPRKGESRRSGHETVGAGHCLYYMDPLQCWARLQSWGLNWLRHAQEYNSSFDYDFPDTCRYTSNSFRCTIPLPGHLATILHTLSFYDLCYQMKVANRGPYRLHLDFMMNLNGVVTLMDLFSAESVLNFQQCGILKRVYITHFRLKSMVYQKSHMIAET